MSEVSIINPEMGLEKSVEAKFEEHKKQADQWLQKAQGMRVIDASQTELMDESRTTRLALRSIRINIEKLHKREKEEFLQAGRKIDALKNKYVALIEPIEKILQENEDFIELQEAKHKQHLFVTRLQECLPLMGEDAKKIPLGEFSQDVYDGMVLGFRAKKEAEEKKAAKDAEDKLEKEKADREEREKLRTENERLRNIEIEVKAKADQEEKELKDKVAADRKEKRQPDKVKLETLAMRLHAIAESPDNANFVITIPSVKDEDADVIVKQVRDMFLKMANHIGIKSKNL